MFNELLEDSEGFDDGMMIDLLLGLGYCNLMIDEYDLAQKYLLQSLNFISNKNESKYVSIYGHLYTLYKRKDMPDSSMYYLQKSLDYAKEYKDAPNISNNSLIISQHLADQGNYREAYRTIHEAFALHDSIFSADLSDEIRKSFLDYQQYQSNKVISSKDQTIQRSNQFMIMLAIIVTLMIIILAFAWRTLTFRRNLNEKLDEMVRSKTSELLDTNQNLVRSRQELDSFLYRTSHDIRGPIATLLGLTSLAKLEARDQLMASYLEKINQTGEKLNTVINRLTNVSQINSQPLVIRETNLYKIVDDVINELKLKNTPVAFRFKGEIPPEIKTDKILVKIILENLLENSFKFYDAMETNPLVELDVVQNGNLELTITDNGLGIDPEYREKVFELFFVAHDKIRGAGIGLYQTLLATEKLQGSIVLETYKKPTRFRVSIPVNGNEEQEKEETAEQVSV